MLGKVKLFFGIEGLKVDLEVPDTFNTASTVISGSLRLHTKSNQVLKRLEVKLIETYHRGRGKDQRTNDYTWGSIHLDDSVELKANSEKIIDFNLPIKPQYSGMDKLGNKSAVHRQVSNLAKWINKAKSEFFIEVSTQVEGTALNPSVKRAIQFLPQ